MSQLSTFFPLNPGPVSNVTFGSVTTGAVTGSGNATFGSIQNTPIGNTTPAAGTFTTLTLADGTRLLPSFFFADDTDTGFFRRGTNTLTFVIGGSSRFEASSAGPRISSADSLSWALNNDLTGSSDLSLFRDAADTLAQRRTTNPQTFRIYNTFTDASNHERGFMRWSSNVLQIGTEAAGTGSARALELQVGGATAFSISTGGNVRIGPISGSSTAILGWNNNCFMRPVSSTAGILTLLNNALDGFNRLQFGGTTSSFPALKRSSTVLQARLADDTDFCPLQGQLRTHANAVSETITATHTLTLYDAAGTAYKVPCVAA